MTTDVACFGEFLWDFYEAEPKGEKEPIARTFRRELGGSSSNVAVALARLGLSASAVGAVGDDKLGAALEAQLAAEGIGSQLVKVAKPTGLTFVVNAGAEPTYSPYRAADLGLAADDITPAMAKARFVLVSTTSMLMREATMKFLDAADKAKAVVAVDLNARAHLWPDADAMRAATSELCKRAALVKASERDLGALAGKRGMSWLEENAKQATWVLTRGENGAAAVGAHGQATAPTKRVRATDRAGAGDAFVAGVLAVLSRAGSKPGGAEWKDAKVWTRALEVGHVLAAKVVAAAGATAGLTALDDVKARLGGAKKA